MKTPLSSMNENVIRELRERVKELNCIYCMQEKSSFSAQAPDHLMTKLRELTRRREGSPTT